MEYDGNEIPKEARFEIRRALLLLMRETCRYMNGVHPGMWTWGRVRVKDLALASPYEFEYGGDEDRPEGADFAIIE